MTEAPETPKLLTAGWLAALLCGVLAACASPAPPAVKTPGWQVKLQSDTVEIADGAEDPPDAEEPADEIETLADVEDLDTLAEVPDAEVDAGKVDAGKVDAAKVDAGKADAGKPDVALADVGKDAGKTDVGKDAGKPDAAEVDAGPADAAVDVADIADSAADSASADAVGDGEASDVWTGVPGGNPGTSCLGFEGEDACSKDGKRRVQCINGAWTTLQHCGFGLCNQAGSPGGATVTSCGVPKAKLKALNQACARYISCFKPSLSHEDCVRINLHPDLFNASLPAGQPQAIGQLAVAQLQSSLACAGAATTCPALAECVQFFPEGKCQGGPNQGCDGQIAWSCGGQAKPLAVNCKALGMICTSVFGAPTCLKPMPCGAVQSASCADTVASLCVSDGAGGTFGLGLDCTTKASTCTAGASNLSGACGSPAKCTASTFTAACTGNIARNCVSGITIAQSCPAGTTCMLADNFDLLGAACPDGQQCPKSACSEGVPCTGASKCNGSELWFCEAKSPAAFECKDVGMTCGVGANGPRCQ